MKRAVIVQGLGFGDEGKGATVDFLARELAADLVVRYAAVRRPGTTWCCPMAVATLLPSSAPDLGRCGDLPRRADDHQPAGNAQEAHAGDDRRGPVPQTAGPSAHCIDRLPPAAQSPPRTGEGRNATAPAAMESARRGITGSSTGRTRCSPPTSRIVRRLAASWNCCGNEYCWQLRSLWTMFPPKSTGVWKF